MHDEGAGLTAHAVRLTPAAASAAWLSGEAMTSSPACHRASQARGCLYRPPACAWSPPVHSPDPAAGLSGTLHSPGPGRGSAAALHDAASCSTSMPMCCNDWGGEVGVALLGVATGASSLSIGTGPGRLTGCPSCSIRGAVTSSPARGSRHTSWPAAPAAGAGMPALLPRTHAGVRGSGERAAAPLTLSGKEKATSRGGRSRCPAPRGALADRGLAMAGGPASCAPAARPPAGGRRGCSGTCVMRWAGAGAGCKGSRCATALCRAVPAGGAGGRTGRLLAASAGALARPGGSRRAAEPAAAGSAGSCSAVAALACCARAPSARARPWGAARAQGGAPVPAGARAGSAGASRPVSSCCSSARSSAGCASICATSASSAPSCAALRPPGAATAARSPAPARASIAPPRAAPTPAHAPSDAPAHAQSRCSAALPGRSPSALSWIALRGPDAAWEEASSRAQPASGPGSPARVARPPAACAGAWLPPWQHAAAPGPSSCGALSAPRACSAAPGACPPCVLSWVALSLTHAVSRAASLPRHVPEVSPPPWAVGWLSKAARRTWPAHALPHARRPPASSAHGLDGTGGSASTPACACVVPL